MFKRKNSVNLYYLEGPEIYAKIKKITARLEIKAIYGISSSGGREEERTKESKGTSIKMSRPGKLAHTVLIVGQSQRA